MLHLAFLPSFALVVAAYTSRPPIAVAFEHGAIERTPANGREARLYAWIRAETPRDAVFLQDPGPEGRECTGNTSELPAFTGRSLFTDYARHYLVAPQPDAAFRLDLVQRLARGEPPTAADDRYLAALRRPLFVVTYDASAGSSARLDAALGAPAFEADGIRVHRWRPHE